ncbi:MAG: guanylate kinase [Flavobacteriales bacterium]|nr:guanylate kinase [Flavobacteriales bacterium]MCB9364548.1 guanylate kinase [Flavobacteriales bacterium]
MEGKCIILCAPSGAGKTSITKYLLQQDLGLEFSISACNREKREGEIDGVDYHFLSTEDFKKKIENNEFIEWEEVYKDNFYGTLKAEIERIWNNGKNVIFDVDVEGGLSLTKYFGEKAMAIFIQPPSMEALEERLRRRGTEDEEKIQKRLAKADKELSYSKWFDTIIVNSNLEESQKEALYIVKSFLKK